MNRHRRLAKILWWTNPHYRRQQRQARQLLHRLQTRSRSQVEILQCTRQHIYEKAVEAIGSNDAKKFRSLADQLKQVADRECRLAASTLLERDPDQHTVIVDASMLVNSFQRATTEAAEGLHYLIGIPLRGARVATEIAEFEYQYRKVTGAAGDHQSTHKLLIDVHNAGRVLVCQMHSHPGSGIDANHPSVTDMRNQKVWEHTTKLVQGIWSRDGYLRWFTAALPFNVQIIGTAMEKVEEHVWKIR